MQKMYLLLAGLCFTLGSMAQTDSTLTHSDTTVVPDKGDTIRIGNMIIIKNGRNHDDGNQSDSNFVINRRHGSSHNRNVSTNWGIIDLGFANFSDKTNYAGAAAQSFAPGSNKSWFDLKNGKSVNVNFWFFMQRLNMIEHVVNLKYGLGLELNNYRFDSDIRFAKNPPSVYRVVPAISYHKNKLAADYITVPLMLNFNFTPHNDNGKSFGFSAGVSGGYLYSSRQKYRSAETGKQKLKGDLGLESFKLAYIAELQLGPVKLYGSLATKSMFENGLDQTPYSFGVRLSNW